MFKGAKIYAACHRIYLDFKFEEDKRAKKYGCLWDSSRNKWYFHKEDYMKSGIKYNLTLHGELSPTMIIDGKIHYV